MLARVQASEFFEENDNKSMTDQKDVKIENLYKKVKFY